MSALTYTQANVAPNAGLLVRQADAIKTVNKKSLLDLDPSSQAYVTALMSGALAYGANIVFKEKKVASLDGAASDLTSLNKKSGLILVLTQSALSYFGNELVSWVNKVLPASIEAPIHMVIKPVVIGATYSLVAKIFLGRDQIVKNFLISAGSELGATKISEYMYEKKK